MNERDMQTMNDTNLVNALREHAEWAERNRWETPITLGDDLEEAADRLENQNAHIAALQQGIEKLRGQLPRWIPVKERLPEYGVRVLATDMYEGDDYTGIWTREEYKDDADGCWYDDHGWWHAIDDATHWMPLPKAPEVMKDE